MDENIIEICPICGIRKINGDFYWSTGVKATPDLVYNKVCINNKKGEGCINKSGTYNEKLKWELV